MPRELLSFQVKLYIVNSTDCFSAAASAIRLTVGFFNKDPTEGNLAPYIDAYDVVLVDDQTFDFPLDLLSRVIAAKCGSQ